MTKLIEVPIVKGVLFLTPTEYAKGLERGKAIKRRLSLEKRTAKPKLGRVYLPDGER